MKHILIFTLLFSLCMQQTIFAMDWINTIKETYTTQTDTTNQNTVELTTANQPLNNLSDEKIITCIDNELKNKYLQQDFFTNFWKAHVELTEEQMLDIFKTVSIFVPTTHQTPSFFSKLYKKNILFSQAVKHFIEYARKNLLTITINNLKTIENPAQQQPIRQLNALDIPIKTYIMQSTLEQVNCFNYKTLKGPNPIKAFDICETTEQLATSDSFYFRLWDLKTDKLIRTFDETDTVTIIVFSHDGSQIATNIKSKDNIVKVWEPHTGVCLYTYKHSHPICSISYTYPNSDALVVQQQSLNIPSQHDNTVFSIWTGVEHNSKPKNYLGKVYCNDRTKTSGYETEKYVVRHPQYTFHPTELHIIELKDTSSYLLARAIENTQSIKELNQTVIESSKSYQNLTSSGMITIIEQLRAKKAALVKILNQQQAARKRFQ